MATATIDVYVKLPTGKTTQFDLLSSDTVKKIYAKIADDIGILEERLHIKYQGKILSKTHTLGYLGVCRETILKAEVIEVKKWTIYVKLPSGETISIDLDNVAPVRDIKEIVHTRDGTLPSVQVLKISNRRLVDMHQRLMDAGITNEAVLTVEVEETPVARANDDDSAAGTRKVTEQEKEAIINSFDSAGRNVEVVFSFDTTGSMASCLQQVRQKLAELMKKLLADIPNIRVGIIAHGDYCDQDTYVMKVQDLTSDVDKLVKFARNTPSTGGGDMPEAYEWVLHKAQQLEWSENAAKALVVIGDAVPHAVSYTDQKINWHTELDVLRGMGIKVYGVQAQTVSQSKHFYKELAERTGGAYVNFSNFSVINDMFMAVCYREVEGEHLQNFKEELEAQENISEEVKDVIRQIQEAPQQPTEQPVKRYVPADWWDPNLDHGPCQYYWDEEKDMWMTEPTFRQRSEQRSRRSPSPKVCDSGKKNKGKNRRSFKFWK